ncbi:MAG: hypothetical protein V2J02_09140 [Pseudomonadales bacterium]|jgi:hypothetical protein|nr:hypothetical protein [Pseudomonadales bacterium]
MALVIDSTTLDLSLVRRATTADAPVQEPKPAVPAPSAEKTQAVAGDAAPRFSTAALDRLGAAMRDVFQRFEAPLALFFDGDDGEESAAPRSTGSLQFSASRVELEGDGFRFSASAFSFSFALGAASAALRGPGAEPPAAVESPADAPAADGERSASTGVLTSRSVAVSLSAGAVQPGAPGAEAAAEPGSEQPSAGIPSQGSTAAVAEDAVAPSAPAPVSASPAAPTPAAVPAPAPSESERPASRAEVSVARSDTRVRVRSRLPEPAEREVPRRSERSEAPSRFSADLRARSSETRFTLDLVTADGDLVRIDFSSLESRLRLRGAAFGEDGLLAAFAGRDRGSVRELAFEVQGELDDEELAQIREFVRDVLKAGRRALRDDGDAFARLARQGVEASEIASFALDYRRTETKLLAKYRTVAGPGDEAAAPASLDGDTAGAVGRLADEARSLTDQGSRLLLRASAETLVARVLGEAVKPVQVPAEELTDEAVAAALAGPESAPAAASGSEEPPADDD